MSLCSTNYISSKTNLKNLFWIIKNLGYKEVSIEKELRHHYKKQYIWRPQNSDLTYVGIELNISKEINNQIEIETRTRVGRSFLEIQHQNLTIKTIKNCFGGRFETDHGKNRYLDEEDCSPERTPISMALYIQKWKLNNSLLPIKIYSDFIDEAIPKNSPAGNIFSDQLGVLPIIDSIRPYVVSNNIQLPYIIGAWENYLKNSFLAILKYANTENKLLKVDRLTNDDLLQIKDGNSTIEECIVNKLSFQRPQVIIENFKKLDKNLDVNSAFQKPFGRRRINLFNSIDKIITLRNQIVHDGIIDNTLTSKEVNEFYLNIIEASNRIYCLFAKQYNFKPNFDY